MRILPHYNCRLLLENYVGIFGRGREREMKRAGGEREAIKRSIFPTRL